MYLGERTLRERSKGPSAYERALGKHERTLDAWEARGETQQRDAGQSLLDVQPCSEETANGAWQPKGSLGEPNATRVPDYPNKVCRSYTKFF